MDTSRLARELTDKDMLSLFDDRTLERGRGYHREGRVESVSDSDELVARVRGNGRSYLVLIDSLDPVTARCTCPIGRYCKHLVATLLTLGAGADNGWRSLLTAMKTGTSEDGTGLAIAIGTRNEGAPLTPHRRSGDSWVMLPWPDITNHTWQSTTDGYSENHVTTLRHLHRTARRTRPWNSPSDILLSDLGTEGLSFLRQVTNAGIVLLDPDMEELEHADDVWSVRLEVEDDEHLTVSPVVSRPDGIRAFVIPGVVPAVAVSQGKLAAVDPRVPAQVQSIVASRGSIHVDRDERLEFEATFIPALGDVDVHSPDGSFTPSQFSQPRLHLYVTRPAGLSLLLQWKQARTVAGRTEPLVIDLTSEDDCGKDRATVERLWDEAGFPNWRGLVGSAQLGPEFLGTFREFFVPRLEQQGIGVTYGEHADIELVSSTPELKVNAASERDWLDLALTVSVDGHDVPLPVLYQALVGGHPYLEFGGIVIDLGDQFNNLRALLREAALLGRIRGKTISVPARQAHSLSLPNDLDGILEERLTRLTELSASVPVPESLEATMRPYQEVGYSWLVRLAQAHYGGILADDMGLGKTLQIIAAITQLKETGQLSGPVLIVAPTSVVSTWVSEAERFTPNLTVTSVTATRRKRMREIGTIDADVIVTSYTLLRLESDDYQKLRWGGLVLDEAQAVKNPRTIGYRALAGLVRDWTFAVTGTPVENTISDLAALFALASPGLLPGPDRFAEKFRRPIERAGDPTARMLLHKLTKPFLMRRRKEDVAQDLPPKISTVVSVPMDDWHKDRYVKQLERERQEVLGLIRDPDGNRISILAALTRLRRLAIDPGLLDERTEPSAKTTVLLEHLESLLPSGHQVLVFSQFTSYLHRIAERLENAKIPYAYLDGSTRSRDRVIGTFTSGEKPVFLISLKAGGVGLTLVEADYVFVMDPWWNPAAEEQAIDRAHRLGQDKHVNVYRLASEDTIEEKVLALQEKKRALAEIVDEEAGLPITAEDLQGLLDR